MDNKKVTPITRINKSYKSYRLYGLYCPYSDNIKKHGIIKEPSNKYNLNIDEIIQFNTRKVLSNLSYLKGGKRKTRKNRH
jgi:hypothetical protein